jgi:hypothetical protein
VSQSDQIVLAGLGSEIRPQFAEWLSDAEREGVRLIVLEGLTGSGKTSLAESFFPWLSCIYADDHLTRGMANSSWSAMYRMEGAALEVGTSLREPLLTLFEGAIAWPTVEPLLGVVELRRVYIKRMQFPGFWADESELEATDLPPSLALRKSILEYHRDERPWEKADLVLERLNEADGT